MRSSDLDRRGPACAFVLALLLLAAPAALQAQSAVYRRAELAGSRPLDDALLLRALGLPVPADSLDAALRRVGSVLYERGFLHATLQQEEAPAGVLRLHVEPGAPVRVAHVFWRGTTTLSVQEARDILGVEPGDVFVPGQLDAGMQALVEAYARRGYLHATAVIERLEVEEEGVVLGIAVAEGTTARLHEVQVQGNTHSRAALVQRLSGLGRDAGLDLRRLRESTALLRRSGLFAAVAEPVLYRAGTSSEEVGVMLRVVEAVQRNSFFGSVGVAQDPRDAQAYLHGAFDLQLRNIWGTGRDLALAWKRDALAGSDLRLGYRERFLFGWRLDLGAELAQTVRDSTYTFQSVGANVVLPLRASLGLELGTSLDRSVFHVGRAGNARRVRGRVGLLYQSLTSELERRPSGKVEVRAEYALKANAFAAPSAGEETDFRQTLWSGLLTGRFPFGSRYEIGARGAWHVLDSDEAEIAASELFYCGGTRTLRGYREDQFRGDQVLYGGVELRYGDLRGSQLYGFVDAGGLRRKQSGGGFSREAHLGYGLGLRGVVATGVFDLAVALGEERSIAGAKLHVALLQRF